MGRPRTKHKQYPPRLHRKGQVFYYVTSGATRKWIRLADNYPEALSKWAEIEGKAHRQDTVSDALRRFVSEELPKLAPTTRKQYIEAQKRLQAVYGNMKLDEVRRADVARYLDKRGGTIANREIAMLSSVYNRAIRWGWAETNPCTGVPRNKEKRRRYVPTPTEIEAIREKAPPSVQRFMDIALLTALRVSDILALTHENRHKDGLHVPIRKTGNTVVYPWSDALRAAVGEDEGPVIRNRKGEAYTLTGFESLWQAARARAKMPQVRIHDLRARALTDAARLRGRDYAQALAAHDSATTTERYLRDRGLLVVEPLR